MPRTVTHEGAIITVYIDFIYVPVSKYISVIPPDTVCVGNGITDKLVGVNMSSPRMPFITYVLTSSFIRPTKVSGRSVRNNHEFIALRNNGFFPAVPFKPPKKSPPCAIAIVAAFVLSRKSIMASNMASIDLIAVARSTAPSANR